MKNDWLNDLKDRMEDYEVSTPDGLWENIESSLPATGSPKVKTLPWLWRSVAVAAAVALGAFGVVKLTDKTASTSPEDYFAENDEVTVVEDSITTNYYISEVQNSPVPEEQIPSSVTRLQGNRTASGAHNRPSANLVAEQAMPAEAVETRAEVAEVTEAKPDTEPESRPVAKKAVEEKTVDEFVTNSEGEDWSGYMSATDDKVGKARRRGISTGLAMSGGAVNSNNISTFSPTKFYRGASPASDTGGDDDENNPVQSSMAPIRDLTMTTNTEHKRPVRIGATVNWEFSNIFGLETGLMYTMLNSTFSTESNGTVTESDQRLHYIGIPLNLTVDFFDSRAMSLYAVGGGMVEKCLSGKVTSATFISGKQVGDPSKADLDVSQLQWSLNAAAGVQMNLIPNVGLYAEPGVSYHFNDGSSVQTIYKDRPFDFMLTLGLRYSFK